MEKLAPHGLFLCLVLTGCSGIEPQPAFESLSVHVSRQGSGGASRSISASGVVHGIHASGAPGAPPMIAESRETARPDDMAEIAKLVRKLPDSAAIQPLNGGEQKSVVRLEILFSTGESRAFYRHSAEDFRDPVLKRLDNILRSYRAGYW